MLFRLEEAVPKELNLRLIFTLRPDFSEVCHKESPRFWAVDFASRLCEGLVHLASHDRTWRLTAEQAAIFKWLFIKLFNEQSQPLAHHEIAGSAWLRLLLVNLERWVSGANYQELLPEQPGTDVLQLWHLVNDCVGRSAEFARRIARTVCISAWISPTTTTAAGCATTTPCWFSE